MGKINVYRDVAKLKNVDMFYFDTKTEGPTILCLHGRWGRAETWYDFIQQYGKEYRIIAPDQRGHGLSSRPVSKYTPEEMAGDIIDLLDHLDIGSIILVGHSMGAQVAGYLTMLYPNYIEAVALLDRTAAGPDEPNPLPLDQISTVDPLTEGWPLPFASLNEARTFIGEVTDTELSYQYFMNSLIERVDGYHMMFSSQAIAAGKTYDTSWYHVLPEIKCSTLLIRSQGQAIITDEDFEKMESMISNCIAYQMSHPDHNIHLANKEEFYQYFDQFLKTV